LLFSRCFQSLQTQVFMKPLRFAVLTLLFCSFFHAAEAAQHFKTAEDPSGAIVNLDLAPLAVSTKTKPAQGKKIDFKSTPVKAYRAQLAARRNDFKAWLRQNAPAAKVTSEFDISLNALAVELNGTSLETLRQGPHVQDVEVERLFRPTADDPDLGLIQAIQTWQTGGGVANAGAEIKVAIIDSGIDVHHPCFSDAGYPAKVQLGDRRFTNNKVIAAKVFYNKANQLGLTAEAIQEHGTHVAGTVACNYNTLSTVRAVTIPYGISGVAPRALLGNYNVFPGPVEEARSSDILNALEAAYADGFDIANMSLGGLPKSAHDILVNAVNNLDQANFVVVVAAGNDGPGPGTVGSPGSAARALTAGASSVPHFVGTPLVVAGQSYSSLVGDFGDVTNNLTAPLMVLLDQSNALDFACSALPPGSATGAVVLFSRGTCTFATKVRNAQEAGALAVLVANNIPGDPIEMAQDDTPNQPTIPAFMVAQTDRDSLIAAGGQSITISSTKMYYQDSNVDIMADFSSQGPTLDGLIKPDVVAPGFNVLSSIPESSCGGSPCFAFFNGTSMATPHLAGSAAILRWLYPNWSASDIRSAIVNTAQRNVLKNYKTLALEQDLNIAGSGRENLLAAANTVVTLDPVSISFGTVSSGSGKSKSVNLTLKNVSDASATYTLSISPPDAEVLYFVSPGSVSLAAGQSTSVTLLMSASKRASDGGHQATLSIKTGEGEVAHAGILSLIQ
jgi:subtilisin family serine protease